MSGSALRSFSRSPRKSWPWPTSPASSLYRSWWRNALPWKLSRLCELAECCWGEVADFNMGRMRVVWGRIWRVLSSHFVDASWMHRLVTVVPVAMVELAEVAAHQNVRVCNFVFRLQRATEAVPDLSAALMRRVPASQAMDSLRQLTMKFLEKDELAGYNFQAQLPATPSLRASLPRPLGPSAPRPT